jgi:hypothetical protein
MEIAVRRAGLSDAEAMWKCYTAPLAVRNTLQMPYRSLESVREQLTKYGEGDQILVAVIDNEVVGVIGLRSCIIANLDSRLKVRIASMRSATESS